MLNGEKQKVKRRKDKNQKQGINILLAKRRVSMKIYSPNINSTQYPPMGSKMALSVSLGITRLILWTTHCVHLRANNLIRQKAGHVLRAHTGAQPYSSKDGPRVGRMRATT